MMFNFWPLWWNLKALCNVQRPVDDGENKTTLIWITLVSKGCAGRMGLGHWWCWRRRSLAVLGPDPSRPLTTNYSSHHAGRPVFYDPQASVAFIFSFSGFSSAENTKPFLPQQLFLPSCFSNAVISLETLIERLPGFLLRGEREADRGSRRGERRGAGEAW